MPFPELNLSLGLTDNDGSVFYAGSGEGKVIVRTDSALKKHTISIVISGLTNRISKFKNTF